MTWAAALTLLKRIWWSAPIALLAAGLIVTRGTLADARADLKLERAQRATDKAIGERDVAEAEAGFKGQLATASETYAARLAAREPIILRSTDTVRTYAETPAGRVLCLAPDRVSGIDTFDLELFSANSASTGRSAAAVPADADQAAGGRISEQR
ncbi:hypothetical protein [Sphingomonas hylomeconis]|uniref:Uncharacterized protein n=1 Tax=Sphingomonas hylomeconis TaxID=1395958 RepID=A0ABV7SQA2_9SPHN|nr:hypothetical protein [Sphingomonas hylomeconis]